MKKLKQKIVFLFSMCLILVLIGGCKKSEEQKSDTQNPMVEMENDTVEVVKVAEDPSQTFLIEGWEVNPQSKSMEIKFPLNGDQSFIRIIAKREKEPLVQVILLECITYGDPVSARGFDLPISESTVTVGNKKTTTSSGIAEWRGDDAMDIIKMIDKGDCMVTANVLKVQNKVSYKISTETKSALEAWKELNQE